MEPLQWLQGSPIAPGAAGVQNMWNITLPPGAEQYYLLSFSRGKWGDGLANGSFNFPWEDLLSVSNVKSDEDQLKIWKIFSSAQRLLFSGDVLQMLMDITPYPIPSRRYMPAIQPVLNVDNPDSTNIHPGPSTHFNVELPDALKRHEKYIDFSEHPSGMIFGHHRVNSSTPSFASLLDQLNLGSIVQPGAEGYFPSIMKIKPVPWRKISQLSNPVSADQYLEFPSATARQILLDWGLIMRSAYSTLHDDHALIRASLERAVLRFLVQRIAYDKIV